MNINNIALVRATNAIPFEGVVFPISEIPYLQKENGTEFAYAVRDMLTNNGMLEKIDWSKPEEIENTSKRNTEICEEYLPYSSSYNSMVLWALNGIVPDDMNNTFSTKKCAIIDGLKEQMELDATVISLAPTDTAIKGSVRLSDSATILIAKDRYEELTEQEKQKLSNLGIKVEVFNGELKEAIEKELNESERYRAEELTLNRKYEGYIESDTSEELKKTISDIASEKEISKELHWNIFWGTYDATKSLDSVKSECANVEKVMDYYKKSFFGYLFSKMPIDDDVKTEAMLNPETKEYMEKLCDEIERIGIDEYKKIVEEYNNNLEVFRQQGKLPTPQQIVDSLRDKPIDLNGIMNETTQSFSATETKKTSKENVYAKECPADDIREYIEQIVQGQQEYLKNGREIPDEKRIPSQIVLSPQNINYLLQSKFVNCIAAGTSGNEIQFFWKKTKDIPALEVKVKRDENGMFYLTYIKEEKSNAKEEFLWDSESTDGKKGIITISKQEEALEDICDMSR